MKKILLVLLVVLIPVLLTGCPFDSQQSPFLMDLPLPSYTYDVVSAALVQVGGTETLLTRSDNAECSYFNTTDIQSEAFNLKSLGIGSTLKKYTWGDYLGGEITSSQGPAPGGAPLEARLILSVPKMHLLHLITSPRFTIDRSRLIIRYRFNQDTGKFELWKVFYFEEWGPDSSNSDALCYGFSASWNAEQISEFQDFAQWGFWETTIKPFYIIKSAFETVREVLAKKPCDVYTKDRDGFREFIGRQTGMDVYKNENPVCKINFEYDSLFGAMPNTELVGKGSLSKITWDFDNGDHYYLLIRSAKFPSTETNKKTSIVVFGEGLDQEKTLENKEWIELYGKATENDLTIYMSGQISDVNVNTKDSTEKVGEEGGMFYAFLHKSPKISDLIKLRALIDLLGLPGVKALGFYFPTAPNSGNGLHNLLSFLIIEKSQKLNKISSGVNLIDCVGLMDLAPFYPEFNGMYEGSPQ